MQRHRTVQDVQIVQVVPTPSFILPRVAGEETPVPSERSEPKETG
jgi:hypothetical protein